MKLSTFSSSNPDLNKFAAQLRRVLSAISKDNMTTQEIIGKTADAADSKGVFKHGLSAAPGLWLPIAGDIYIPQGGLGTAQIDVRSSKINETFTVLLIR